MMESDMSWNLDCCAQDGKSACVEEERSQQEEESAPKQQQYQGGRGRGNHLLEKLLHKHGKILCVLWHILRLF